MLTQGYRKFEWKQILSGENPKIAYQPETSLNLSGTIKTLSNKPVANGRVRLTSIKDHFAEDTVTDANGNFTFKNMNLYDTTKVIINAKKANGGDNVKISIKKPSYPAVQKTPVPVNSLNADIPESVLAAMKTDQYRWTEFKKHYSIKRS